MLSRGRGLLKEISKFSSPVPDQFDPDLDIFQDGTVAVHRHEEDLLSDDDHATGNRSYLRSNVELNNLGKDYSAKKVLRKSLRSPTEEFSSEGSGSDDIEGSSLSSDNFRQEYSDSELESEQHEHSGSDTKVEANDSNDAPSTSSESESEDDGPQKNVFAQIDSNVDDFINAELSKIEKEDAVARDSRAVDNREEIKKAKEALRQRKWWENYLEIRILLQKLLDVVNRLPSHATLPAFKATNPEIPPLLDDSIEIAEKFCRDLSLIRKQHMQQAFSTNELEGIELNAGGLTSIDSIWNNSINDYNCCKTWWEQCANRWQRKTQKLTPALQNKFKTVNQGVWSQVSASMADTERSKRKLFALKSDTAGYLGRFLEQKPDAPNTQPAEDCELDGDFPQTLRRTVEPIDVEVIDDGDFYHHLLKEFIESAEGSKGGNYTAGLSSMHRNKKRKFDKNLNKKLRYDVHEKLQNFMFPERYGVPPTNADELFASLFGKNQNE